MSAAERSQKESSTATLCFPLESALYSTSVSIVYEELLHEENASIGAERCSTYNRLGLLHSAVD